MHDPKIIIYHNIPSPYRNHLWQAIFDNFPGLIIFTETMESQKYRTWEDEAAKYAYPHKYMLKNLYIPKIGYLSAGLVPWILSHGRNNIHMLFTCGRANNYLLRFLVPRIGGRLIHCLDGAFVEDLTERSIRRYKNYFKPAISGVFAPGLIGKTYFKKLGYHDEEIFNSYFSHDVDFYTAEWRNHRTEYRNNLRGAMDIPADHLVLLTVSRLLDWKRLEDLNEALRILDSPRFAKMQIVVIGDGDHSAPVHDIEKSLKFIRFHWIKGVPYRDMPKYYAMADVLVLPSEGDIWGLVINEALSMGLPVICTNRIGAAELVRDGKNGFLVPPRSPALIAERIALFMDNQSLLSRFSETALDIRERWNTRLALESVKRMVKHVMQRS